MPRKPVVVETGQGRVYPMGRMQAIFKVDEAEGVEDCSVSEWWLEPNTAGPPVHDHPEAHVFYVIQGTMTLFVAGDWFAAPRGSYVSIPGGVPHTFENRSDGRSGFISFNVPGGFERQAEPIARWFEDNPLGDASD